MVSPTSAAEWPTALALVLVALVPFAFSSPAPATIIPRTDGEHVVLADCRDSNNVLSSQMAYFPGNPSGKPQDVSIVKTPASQAALWVGATTSGLFTTTGVTFVANLSSKVADGQFAGTGNNGYGDFTCWQRYTLNLYKYGNTTCSQVYDCDHETAPSASPSSSPSVTPTSIPTVSSTPSPNNNNTSNSNTSTADSHSSTLSAGVIAGIIIGVVIVVATGLASAGFIWVRKRSEKNKKAAELHGSSSWGQELHDDPIKSEADGLSRTEIDGMPRAEAAELEAREK